MNSAPVLVFTNKREPKASPAMLSRVEEVKRKFERLLAVHEFGAEMVEVVLDDYLAKSAKGGA